MIKLGLSGKPLGCISAVMVLCLGWSGGAYGLEHVTIRHDGAETQIVGRVLAEPDDGLMLETRAGRQWLLEQDEIVARTRDDVPFTPFDQKEMARHVLDELPRGFDVHVTQNWVICYNTSQAYAHWCGALFERLHGGFKNFWKYRGFDLKQAEFPLVAVVFADQASFVEYAKTEVEEGADRMIAFYSLRTNRVALYDLTGVEALVGRGSRWTKADQINLVLSQPRAEMAVRTIVHEATHQISYNCGMFTRYADCPLWLSEGIAVYFETPDLRSSRGWRTIGALSQRRLARFRSYLPKRPPDSLATLLSDDMRLRRPELLYETYAEAWALTYYLLKRYPKQYTAYLKLISQKKPLRWDNAETRLDEFRRAFGFDLERLDVEFLRFVSGLRG